MQQRTFIGALAVTGIALLSGCYPQGAEYIDDYDLVYTDYSPTFDFRSSTTYALPDSVVKITGNLQDGEAPEMVDQTYASEILKKIRDNMNANGWTMVGVNESPDVVILPSMLSVTTTTISYPGYWGWYYPYYGYGWYYPGYYPPTISSYTTGSLIILMTNPKEMSPSETIPVEWVCAVNGLLEGSTSNMISRIDKTVDQAFTQSLYLKH